MEINFQCFSEIVWILEDMGGEEGKDLLKLLFLQKKHSYVIPTQMLTSPGIKTVMSFYTAVKRVIMNTKFLNHWQLKKIKTMTQKSLLPRVSHLWKRRLCPAGVIYILNINKTEVIFSCTTGRVVFFPVRTLSNESHDFIRLYIKT